MEKLTCERKFHEDVSENSAKVAWTHGMNGAITVSENEDDH